MNPHPALTRRQSLAFTGAAALGATITSVRAQNLGSQLRIGLIGCGGRGTGAADQALSVPASNVKLVAMGDAFENRVRGSLDGLKKKHAGKVDVPAERQFVGPDAYLKVIEQSDVVLLATPPGFRPFHFEAAIKAGKHVFMEKPVCVDAFGARLVIEMAKLADEKQLKVVVGLQRRYQNVYHETLKQIREGAIGDIVSANVYWNGGPIWHRAREAGMNELQFQLHNWYHFSWLCGDHIAEQHVHNLDVANWFIGALPESAYGFGGRQVRRKDQPTEIYDHHSVEYLYPNGVIVNSMCKQIPGGSNRVTEVFRGTKGIANIGRITDFKGNVVWSHRAKDDPNPYQVEHDRLHEAILNNKPLNNAEYGATSSFTAVLGRYCTYTGKEWKWDAALKLNHRTMPDGLNWNTPAPVQPDADGQYRLPTPGEYQIA